MPEDPKTLLSLYGTMVKIRQFETMASENFAAGQIPGRLDTGFSRRS